MIRHLGSSLTDVTYVFDEPTIGLHPHDIQRMNNLLVRLRDKGNTVLVVEHKPEAIAIADHVVDLGPGAGDAGGTVCSGTVEGLRASDTLTGRHLDDRAHLKPRCGTPRAPWRSGAPRPNNLQDVDVDIPLGVLGVITGVAGSGKSSLIHGSVAPRRRGVGGPGRDPRVPPQQPGHLHRAARPDPQGLRQGQRGEARPVQPQLRGRLPELQRGRRDLHRPGDDGGVATVCEDCEGKRFQASVLEYHLGGKDIAEVLDMSVTEADGLLRPTARRAPPPPTQDPAALADVGLGYVRSASR
jgi:excinuclease UvrABC ATPase subunit